MPDHDAIASHERFERACDTDEARPAGMALERDCESQPLARQRGPASGRGRVAGAAALLPDAVHRAFIEMWGFLCSLAHWMMSTGTTATLLVYLFLSLTVLGVLAILDLRQGAFPMNKVMGLAFIMIGIAICSRLRSSR